MKGLRLTERGKIVLAVLLGGLVGLGYGVVINHGQAQACQAAQQSGTAWRIERECGVTP